MTSLNLSLCNITAVPSYICYLHALERLTLIGNKLTRCDTSVLAIIANRAATNRCACRASCVRVL